MVRGPDPCSGGKIVAFIPTAWTLNPSTCCCDQAGVINKGTMAELAKALGPRIRDAHNRRMGEGAKADQVEMMKVSRYQISEHVVIWILPSDD